LFHQKLMNISTGFLVDPEVRPGWQVQVKVTVALGGSTAFRESDTAACGGDGVVTVAVGVGVGIG